MNLQQNLTIYTNTRNYLHHLPIVHVKKSTSKTMRRNCDGFGESMFSSRDTSGLHS